MRQFFYLPDIDVFLEKDPSSCRLKYVWCYYNFQSYFQSITPLIHLLQKVYRPIDAETVKQRNQNWSSRLTISTNPTDPPGMQCSWVYEVRLNPSLSLCRLTDTSVESANLHVNAINFQWFLFCIQNKNSMQYPVVFVYFIEGLQNYCRWWRNKWFFSVKNGQNQHFPNAIQ